MATADTSNEGTAYIWNVVSGNETLSYKTLKPVIDLKWAWLSDDIITMHNSMESNIRVWNNGKLISILETAELTMQPICGYFNETGEIFISLCAEGRLRFWRVYKKPHEKSEMKECSLKAIIR